MKTKKQIAKLQLLKAYFIQCLQCLKRLRKKTLQRIYININYKIKTTILLGTQLGEYMFYKVCNCINHLSTI